MFDLLLYNTNSKFYIYSIDATDPRSGLGRYANDDWVDPNARIVREDVNGVPHLFLRARRHIDPDTEIRYDYGQPDAQWRKVSSKV